MSMIILSKFSLVNGSFQVEKRLDYFLNFFNVIQVQKKLLKFKKQRLISAWK